MNACRHSRQSAPTVSNAAAIRGRKLGYVRQFPAIAGHSEPAGIRGTLAEVKRLTPRIFRQFPQTTSLFDLIGVFRRQFWLRRLRR